MQKALTARLQGWLKPGRKGKTVGIELQSEGMALAVCDALASAGADSSRADKARFSGMDFLRYEKNTDSAQQLKNWVAGRHLHKAACHVVLGADAYQILLVEPPDVPQEEIRAAIRWRLKDLISIPVDQAAVDVFALPADGIRANKKMVYVVVCESKKIRAIVDMVDEAGLKLESIDINELALRNLMLPLLPPELAERGVALARIRSGAASVYIYRAGNLYLGRSFSLNYNGGLLDSLPEESLALELQRSLDYYERQMGQAPPAVIYVCGEHVSEDKIGEVLKTSLAPRVQWLNPALAMQIDAADLDEALVQRCVAATGAALRRTEVV
ncbi:MAG: pilus assembly protein PilM [Cellvibrionaceae bacterium]|nr:pilus assembly protein PilM [Cellvibrionaceae bacterium]